MKRKQKLWLIVALVAVIALVLSGCGSSSGASSKSVSTSATGDTASGANVGAATADVGTYGTDTYDTGEAVTADSYAVDDSETAEVTEESAVSSADSQTLTDADAAGAAEGTETGGTTESTESGESSDGTETGEPEEGKDDTSSYEQKLIRTVNLTAETTDFDKLVAGVKAETEELGGYVESSEMDTSTDSTSRWAYLTLRIPAEKLDAFLEQVNEETNVTYSSESTEDVTLTYSDLESHVAALRTEQETLLSMLEQATTMEDILAIQSQLTEVRYEIESYESQLKVYDNQVTYSTVYLDISEVVRESSGTGITFGEQVGNRFSDSLYNIANGFRNFAIGFLGAIPYLVILAVVAVACVFAFRKIRKRKKRNRDKKLEKNEDSQE